MTFLAGAAALGFFSGLKSSSLSLASSGSEADEGSDSSSSSLAVAQHDGLLSSRPRAWALALQLPSRCLTPGRLLGQPGPPRGGPCGLHVQQRCSQWLPGPRHFALVVCRASLCHGSHLRPAALGSAKLAQGCRGTLWAGHDPVHYTIAHVEGKGTSGPGRLQWSMYEGQAISLLMRLRCRPGGILTCKAVHEAELLCGRRCRGGGRLLRWRWAPRQRCSGRPGRPSPWAPASWAQLLLLQSHCMQQCISHTSISAVVEREVVAGSPDSQN